MKVPEYQDSEELQPLPDARQRLDAGPDNFLGATAQAGLNAAAEGVERANRAAADIYSAQLQEANQARAQDALNRFEQARQDRLFGPNGAFNVKGAAVFSQPDSQPLADKVRDDLRQSYADIAAGLGNEEQQRLFAAHALPAIEQSYGQTLQHENQQYQAYRKGVNLDSIETSGRNAALNYNNPEILQQSVQAIKTASLDLARLDGMPDSHGATQAAGQVSAALQSAFDAALQQNDQASAMQILKHFSPDMDTGGLMKMYARLQSATDARNAVLIGGQVMAGFLPRMDTSDSDRAFNLLISSESGGRHFAEDGAVLKNSSGAVGISQLLPKTAEAVAKAAGLPWRPALFNRGRSGDAGLDAEAESYNRQLGRAYFDSQLRDFHGDPGLAYAAYNAGPGAVRAALKKVAADGGDWLEYLPKETRNYVGKNLAAYAAGEGGFERPTLAEVLAAADSHLQRVYGETASPALRKQVQEHVANAYDLQERAIRQRHEEGVAEAMRQLQLNGGDYAGLQVAVRAGVPADKVDDVIGFGRRLGKGLEPETDWSLYYRLKTNRLLLKNANLMAYRNRLADAEFKQLTADQQGGGGHGPTTQVRAAGDVLHSFMLQAGIDPNPKPDDRAAAGTVGRIWSAYEQRVADFEALHGRKASTQDLEKVAAQLFTRVPVRGVLYGTHDKPAVLVDMAKDKVVVPEADRRQIEEAWRKVRPGEPIGEDRVFATYLRKMGLL
ncbi:MAG: transglycosylase SLT domain-containing protein [Methylococcales bacterium]|nr:transglycosylase SLT domain-containing protein [Methylococcales bacterium]